MSDPFLLRQPHQFQHVVDRLLPLRRRNLVAGAEEIQVFGHLHVLIDAEEVRHVADDVPHRVGLAHHVVAEDLRRAGRRGQERRQDAQRGRLAGAVRADEAEQVAFIDGEVQPGQSGDAAIHARQAERLNGGDWRCVHNSRL